MIITVNDKQMEVAADFTPSQLLEQLEIPPKGAAVAVNDSLVSRTDWQTFALQENDTVLIIRAASGG